MATTALARTTAPARKEMAVLAERQELAQRIAADLKGDAK
jgi:hypothetical protein